MNTSKRQLLGCLVTDGHTGEPLGRVRSVVYDPQGETVTEILVTGAPRPLSPGDLASVLEEPSMWRKTAWPIPASFGGSPD